MIKQPEKWAKVTTWVALAFLVVMGFVMAVFELKPFWVDEWRIIYNLKTKDAHALWGQLDFMQQFPRAYLQVVKAFTTYFDYSYTALRLPSFVIGTITILLTYRLMQKMYPTGSAVKFLFVLIVASSPTFVVYYVQVKQYTMDILLSIVALWQLNQLLQLKEKKGMPAWRYLLLCCSFLLAPFLCYSYPILTAPLFAIATLQSFLFKPEEGAGSSKTGFIIKLWLPLILCLCSMAVFYLIDVAQLMDDGGMKLFWAAQMMQKGFDPLLLLKSFFFLFANLGNGLLFELIFGIAGVAAFVANTVHLFKNFRLGINDTTAQLRLYAILLVAIILGLFVIGKLPIGEARLNSYSVPAIAILLIYFIDHALAKPKTKKWMTGFVTVLFLGTVGNIISSQANSLSGKENEKKLAIYRNVTEAIRMAQAKNLPIFVTSAVAHPCEKVIKFPNTDIKAEVLCYAPGYSGKPHFNKADEMPADWVVMTLPAYKMSSHLPVYAIDDIRNSSEYIIRIPNFKYTQVVAVNDTVYWMHSR